MNQAKWLTFSPWFHWNHPISAKRWSFSCPVSIFSLIVIFFLQYSYKRSSHAPAIWPVHGLIFNILFQTHWLYPFYYHYAACLFCERWGTCGSREINIKISQFPPSFCPQINQERSHVTLFLLSLKILCNTSFSDFCFVTYGNTLGSKLSTKNGPSIALLFDCRFID